MKQYQKALQSTKRIILSTIFTVLFGAAVFLFIVSVVPTAEESQARAEMKLACLQQNGEARKIDGVFACYKLTLVTNEKGKTLKGRKCSEVTTARNLNREGYNACYTFEVIDLTEAIER